MAEHYLKSADAEVKILTDWGYARSRYDSSAAVEQVTVGGHTFLSREQHPDGGTMLSGIGLINVFEWEDTALFDETPVGGQFPLLGVGLLTKPDAAPFDFTREYVVEPFEREITADAGSVTARTLPRLCAGIAAETVKTYTLDGNRLTVRFSVRNAGERPFRAKEFCHNFICFDGQPINADYKVSFPYPIGIWVRRGEFMIRPQAYRIGEFDAPTASSAFWMTGWEGLPSHEMTVEHLRLGTAIRIEDDFPLCHFYAWQNPSACCPEVFAPLYLAPGETVTYTRRYTFTV